jgi:hypothetical protein
MRMCFGTSASLAPYGGGRMELHLLIVRDGNKPRRWMLPQRSDRSVVHEGLIRIDEKVPPDSEATMEKRNCGRRMRV